MTTIPNLSGGIAENLLATAMKWKGSIVTLAAQVALGKNDHSLQMFDPGGAARDVLLPPEADSKDRIFIIVNLADAAESLVVKEDSDTTVIATLVGSVGGTANQAGIFHCDGVTWRTVLTATRDVS